jgi:hypothetical protein
MTASGVPKPPIKTRSSDRHNLDLAGEKLILGKSGTGVKDAQLMARSRADLSLFDALIASFTESGLIPT